MEVHAWLCSRAPC
ncbi:hypothetical protein SMACR_05499 [Sordaria macrospora]|nr:hypothetical protein SMACR_05499 [Sordaria macrospora]